MFGAVNRQIDRQIDSSGCQQKKNLKLTKQKQLKLEILDLESVIQKIQK